jgi:hypothetical protein
MAFEGIKRGLVLTRDSIFVLKHNPRLLAFPVVAAVSAIAFLLLLLGPVFGALIGLEGFDGRQTIETVVSDHTLVVGAVLFVAYLVTTFISVFFTGALIAESRAVFGEGGVDLKRGMAVAWEAKYKLLAWALVSATVGVAIESIESSDSPVTKVIGLVIGLAWTVLTFFVVPVAVLERDSTIRSMFSDSGRTFREHFGETVIGLGIPRLLGAVVAVAGITLGVLLAELGGGMFVYVPITISAVVLSQLLSTTIRGILKTSLYVYATEGKRPPEFANQDFETLGAHQSGKRW